MSSPWQISYGGTTYPLDTGRVLLGDGWNRQTRRGSNMDTFTVTGNQQLAAPSVTAKMLVRANTFEEARAGLAVIEAATKQAETIQFVTPNFVLSRPIGPLVRIDLQPVGLWGYDAAATWLVPGNARWFNGVPLTDIDGLHLTDEVAEVLYG